MLGNFRSFSSTRGQESALLRTLSLRASKHALASISARQETAFQSWWREGFEKWRQRHAAEPDARCVFLCELGPPPYGITGPDGYELADRWADALTIKSMAENIWNETA